VIVADGGAMNRMDDDVIIEVDGLTVKRGGTTAIIDASFAIRRRDYVGIVGPNGGGKTTLIKAILGVIPRDTGRISLFGEPLENFSSWEKIAYVSQDATNFDMEFPLTVREMISLGCINKKNLGRRLSTADWEKVDEVMEFMGISDLAGKRIGHLSGGQKQRVFVAKSMVLDPEVLILDEPVTGVDAETTERFYMKLGNLNLEKGTTILDVSHNLSAVFCRMSRLLAVNQRVYSSEINPSTDPNIVLSKAYGEHFHFVFHEHMCRWLFKDA